jgi:hypothetical protein
MFPKLSIPSLELEGKLGPYSSFRTIPETFFTSTLARGANTALSFVNSRQLNSNESFTMLRIANVIEDNMDGTSEPIFSIFLSALASAPKSMPSTKQMLDAQTWGVEVNASLITV